MPTPREELEARRRLAQGDLSPREELEIRRSLAPQRQTDTLAQSFNRGVVDLVNAPLNLVNAGLRGAQAGLSAANVAVGGQPSTGDPSIPGTQELEQAAQNVGVIGEEPGTGVAARAFEIAGSSALPTAALLQRGQQIANPVLSGLSQSRSVVSPVTGQSARSIAPQSVLVGAGQAPAVTTLGELGASTTAAMGGEIAEGLTDDPTLIALGEVAGGFTPAAAMGVATTGLTGRASRAVTQAVAPFTRAGAEPRAARRLQSQAADPGAAARAVQEGDPNLSPARRTGDERLLALEREILNRDPELDAQFSEQLRNATRQAEQAARAFGGDTERPRELLRTGRDHLLNTLRVRASQASERAQREIEALGQDATPRQISSVARSRLDEALGDARRQERELWGAIDKDQQAGLENARETLGEEISRRSRFDDPEDIPAWLRQAVSTEVPVSVQDVQALRSRVLAEIRAERAKDAPNRNKIRVLNDVQDGLLTDLGQVDAEGVGTALAFSRELNERFTQGRVGQLLGFQRAGGEAVAPADMLDRLLTGQAGTNIRQFLRATPDGQQEIEQFLKGRYLEQVSDPGFKRSAHDAFIRRFRRSGVWEELPNLERELLQAGQSQNTAERLGIRQARAQEAATNPRRSRTALYLDASPGEEMRALLRAKNPVVAARSIHRRMNGDEQAIQGLKEQFVDEMFSASQTSQFDDEGVPIVSGNRLNRLLQENRQVAKALGMTDAELARLNRTVQTFRQAEKAPARGDQQVMSDTPATILNFLARLIGAQSGQRAAQGMGSSLVMAQFGSERMRAALQRITNDRAYRLVVEAHSDPELYRALLTKSTDNPERQARAARKLNAWLTGVAADVEE